MQPLHGKASSKPSAGAASGGAAGFSGAFTKFSWSTKGFENRELANLISGYGSSLSPKPALAAQKQKLWQRWHQPMIDGLHISKAHELLRGKRLENLKQPEVSLGVCGGLKIIKQERKKEEGGGGTDNPTCHSRSYC